MNDVKDLKFFTLPSPVGGKVIRKTQVEGETCEGEHVKGVSYFRIGDLGGSHFITTAFPVGPPKSQLIIAAARTHAQ